MRERAKALIVSAAILVIGVFLCAGEILADDPGVFDEVIIGNLDGSSIEVYPGEVVNIPVWIRNDEDVAFVHIPVSTDDQYVAARLGGNLYYPFTDWEDVFFSSPYPDGNNPGWTNQSLAGWADISGAPNPYLNTGGSYLKVAEFTIEISPSLYNIGDITLFREGLHPQLGAIEFGDTLGANDWQPYFLGNSLKIMSVVYLENITGVGDIVLIGDSVAVRPALTIASNISTSTDMHIVIRDETMAIVYSDDVYSLSIAAGVNVLDFSFDWMITSAQTYTANAVISAIGDTYADDDSASKLIVVTDFAYGGLPPPDTGEGGLSLDVPVGYTAYDQDGDTLHTYWIEHLGQPLRTTPSSIAMLAEGANIHWEWLVQGPFATDTTYIDPAVYFWEYEVFWGEDTSSYHEFYVDSGTFSIADAESLGAIETHTTGNHVIHGFDPNDDSTEIALPSWCDGQDSLWFAWKYVSQAGGDHHYWYIDQVTWYQAGFLSGDTNGDGLIRGSDVTYLVRYLKQIGPPPDPLLAGDTNGDCLVRGSDVTYLVRYLKQIGDPPIRGDC